MTLMAKKFKILSKLLIALFMMVYLTGCTLTEKTTIETKDGQTMKRTTIGLELFGSNETTED